MESDGGVIGLSQEAGVLFLARIVAVAGLLGDSQFLHLQQKQMERGKKVIVRAVGAVGPTC